MTDPERLMVSGSGFEKTVLGAGAVEKPSAALVARMEEGLGLSGAATATATATLSGKLVATIAASVAVGGIALWSLSGDPPSPPSATPVGFAVQDDAQQAPPSDEVTPTEADSIPEPKSVLNQGAAGDVAGEPGDRDEDASRKQTSRTQLRSSRPAEAVPPSTVSGTSDRLKEEVRLLDRVRGALESGQKTRALSLLDQYQERFPEGVLRPEARKLRQNADAL